MSLQQQFEAAAKQVDNLDPATAAPHMTALSGLYKQATEGAVNTQPGASQYSRRPSQCATKLSP